MFLFYVDETGNRDPRMLITRKNGTVVPGDPIYTLTAVSLFDHNWRGFERTINNTKLEICRRIQRDHQVTLDLADCEIKSNWLRQPREREQRPFLKFMTEQERLRLVSVFYEQLSYHKMHVFSIVIDKRKLHAHCDQDWIHRKSWQKLLFTVERFMRSMNPRHRAIMINDDVSVQTNRMLAMEHARLVDKGTQEGLWLNHICEMPMFVRSELSNGVQLADLCSYNIYRAIKSEDMGYGFFKQIEKRIWSPAIKVKYGTLRIHGLFVIPGQSQARKVVDEFEQKRAPA